MSEQAKTNIRRWREDPISFVREVFDVEPDPWQADILSAFPVNQRLAMKACKGPGKTCVLSWLCWNFLLTRPYPKIAATSISFENLADGLWAEMAKWMYKSPLLKNQFQWTKTRIFCKDYSETWFMSARAWSKSATKDQQANTLAGLHADYIMFILDESGGIPDAVMAAAEAALSTGIECKLVQAGNPTHLEGPLYRAVTNERHLWFVAEITGDPDDPKRAPRISKKWAREQIEKYGKDNPWVLVNVFGQFPPSSMNTLLGPEEVTRAMRLKLKQADFMYAQKRLGIDVARFGDDRTILFPRQGLQAFKPVVMRNARSNEIAARIISAKFKWKSEMEFIDDTGGYGSGVVDSLIQANEPGHPINHAGKALNPKYYNKRAENWFLMAEWVKRGGCLPNIPEMIGELITPQYTFKNGKFLLEPKDQIKDRLGRSPDYADALSLTFSLPEMQAETEIDKVRRSLEANKNQARDYDPLARD
jgi:hypothetical protein